MLGAKSVLLMAVFFIVIALLLSPTVLFLTNGHLMRRTVHRAVKSRMWHLDLTLQDRGRGWRPDLGLLL